MTSNLCSGLYLAYGRYARQAERTCSATENGAMEFTHRKTLVSRCMTRWWPKGYGPTFSGIRIPYAYCYRCSFKARYPECGVLCADYITEAVANNSCDGVVIPPKEFLQKIDNYCRANGILVIADEVLTGTGRIFF